MQDVFAQDSFFERQQAAGKASLPESGTGENSVGKETALLTAPGETLETGSQKLYMKAMVLNHIGSLAENKTPLRFSEVPVPVPKIGEVLIKISVCGVCHTELDEIEGRALPAHLPVIPGHEVVGRVVESNTLNPKFKAGDRVGVAWIFSACGECTFCKNGFENLCDRFVGTGRDVNGGYAEYMTAPEAFVHAIPGNLTDQEAAPLLCAGSIGYRAVRLSGIRNGQSLGLVGFGASAHLVLKMVHEVLPDTRVFVFSRNQEELTFAKELGAYWTGTITTEPPQKLQVIIDTTPSWNAVVRSMHNLEKGGRLVINVIQKEEIDKTALNQLFYAEHLWLEKELKTVANITRKDVTDFLQLASRMALKSEVRMYRLEKANEALHDLKFEKARGARVLQI